MSAVVVVGAGIVGASVAYHLARHGVAVTVVERERAPAAGVTGRSFGWIGGLEGGDWPGGAEDLRGSVLDDYRRLEAEVPGVSVRWTGSLAWAEEGDRPGGGRRVGREEVAVLEPNLRMPPERAVYIPEDGGVDPVVVTEALLRAARSFGVRVVHGADVTSLRVVDGRVDGVVSSSGVHDASAVVLAAGTGVAALCEPLGVRLPVAVSPAFLISVASPPGLVRTVVGSPEFEVREVGDGRLLMTAPLTGEDLSPEALERPARQAVERLRAAFGGVGPLRLLDFGVGRRPVPEGGPVIGYPVPGASVYVAVMHSGVTLAPTVGRLVAREIVTGEPAGQLRNCRPRPGPVSRSPWSA